MGNLAFKILDVELTGASCMISRYDLARCFALWAVVKMVLA